jgi:multiple sugar transport system substrate-binding protein
MRTTRSLRGIGAVAIATALVAACGGTPEGGPGQVEGSASDAPEGATTVTFWQTQFTDEENEWYEGVVDDFNASQDEIFVEYSLIPGDAWDQRLTAAQAAGNAPDVYTQSYGNIPDGARTGQLMSVTDLISADAWSDLQDNVLEMVTVDGEQYGYPLLVEPSAVLYYRTDLFEEAGIEGPPTTWDELIDYANRLSSDEVFGVRLATAASDLTWSTWGYQQNVAGHWPINDDWSAPANNEDYIPLFDVFRELFSTGALPPSDGLPYADGAPFGDGRYAMMANGSWAGGQLLAQYPEIVENVAVAAMPTFDGGTGQTTATLGGWTLVVDGKTDTPDEAGQFIEWVLGGDIENVLPFFEATAYSKVSPRTSVADAIAADPSVADVNPWNATIQEDIVPFAVAEPTYPYSIQLAMGEAIEAAMQGASNEDVIRDLNSKIQTEIDNQGLAGSGS